MNEEKIIVLDFGGSIMVPDEIDASLIKKLRAFVEQKIRQGYFFVIIIGGGKTTRRYQQAGRALKFTDTLLDTIGIACTRVNATFLKNVCARLKPYPSVIENPLTLNQKIVKKYRLCFLGGWKPGASTDYVSFVAARTLGVEKIFMMSNIEYLYDKDPKKFKNARPIFSMIWHTYNKMFSGAWKPGMHCPIDPVAARFAQKYHIKTFFMGNDIKNLGKALEGKKFKGTTIG